MDGVVLDTVIDDKVKQICYGKYRVKQICLVKHICYTNMSATRNITGVKTPIFTVFINPQKWYVYMYYPQMLQKQQYSPYNNHYPVS